MIFDRKRICPQRGTSILGFRVERPCVGERCQWFIHIRGKDPQSGRELDEPGCAIAWQPILQIEGNLETRQAAAAVESFRNRMVRIMDRTEGNTRQTAALAIQMYQTVRQTLEARGLTMPSAEEIMRKIDVARD